MYREKTVAVVVPAYNEEVLIRKVIETMPSFVDKILVVNDKSTDNTAVVVQEYVRRDPDRVALLDLKVNQGVGGAIAEGYKWARDSEIDCTAVMAGDAQMDPDDLPKLLDPVVEGRADYTKGNRLFYGDAWHMIPRLRYLGNSGLSLLTKIASGYWHVADSQTGYTVASLQVLKTLDLDRIYKRYGMPNDMLVKLNVYDFRVKDVHVKPVYNIGETSGIKIRKVFFTIPLLLFRLFMYRMVQKYIIRNTHPLVFFYLLGGFMLLLDVPLAVRLIFRWTQGASVTVENAFAVLFCAFMGFQSILFAMLFDMEANKDLQGK
ncbi:MAG TPA: glycosyltransferase family 2 protein [Candidatus Hydrogenedentes bacterium]|nr:glycosyltransferase family 2 protein [Candidatus Hydrogenedentota bacterium]HQE84548.1 glycosyltransferase family 2 protein [Candidatus Hydrogenedentota bacterium]HQH50819.1 glycosyltransferase family 2 protein [Candidatus Hydrogenedentota bacterium]HQM47757.1 glycosyltransferase family 2 protein [Candidatus Hydrogenedentota bacterium]